VVSRSVGIVAGHLPGDHPPRHVARRRVEGTADAPDAAPPTPGSTIPQPLPVPTGLDHAVSDMLCPAFRI
jgi:hypothetical protein